MNVDIPFVENYGKYLGQDFHRNDSKCASKFHRKFVNSASDCSRTYIFRNQLVSTLILNLCISVYASIILWPSKLVPLVPLFCCGLYFSFSLLFTHMNGTLSL